MLTIISNLLMTLLLILLPFIVLALWYLYDARQDRLEQEREQAARDLQDTIMQIAYDLAQSQDEATQAAIRAAREHSEHLKP